jgi:translation initiation factor IF-1
VLTNSPYFRVVVDGTDDALPSRQVAVVETLGTIYLERGGHEMNVTWRRVLAGSSVVVILLALGALELVSHRAPVDAFSRTGSNPGSERATSEALLKQELVQPADWEAAGAAESAVAPDHKSLTAAIQTGRMTVLKVNREANQIVSLNSEGRVRVTTVSNKAVVVTEDKKAADLTLLNAGDLIQVEPRDGQVQRIRVLRRAWQETTSPER